jgi:hypothetical protein
VGGGGLLKTAKKASLVDPSTAVKLHDEVNQVAWCVVYRRLYMYCRSPLLYANMTGGGYPLPPAVSGGEEHLPERAAGLGLILSSIFNPKPCGYINLHCRGLEVIYDFTGDQ